MARLQSDYLGQDEFNLGEDINLNVGKTLSRNLTLYIEPLIPMNTTQDDRNKISTTDMLSWFQTKVNIAEFVKCFQKVNDRFFLTCKDEECKEVLLNDFSRFEIRDIVYLMRNAHPLTWESRKNYIDITIYNLPFEIKPDSVIQKFQKYATIIIELRSPTFRSFPTIQSGVRVVRVKALHTHIPRRIFIKGQPITVKYDGQQPPDKKCHNCGEYGHISRECSQEKRPAWGFSSSGPRPSEVRPDNTDEDLGSATGNLGSGVRWGTGFPPFDGRLSSNNTNTDEYEGEFPSMAGTESVRNKDEKDGVEGKTEKQEVRNQEVEPEVRDNTESREPNEERQESNQIQKDEVRDQNEQIEVTEEREEGEVIDSENENEGKNSDQNEKQNTFAEDLIDVLSVEDGKSEKVTIENPILSNIDDDFPTIDIISPLKSPVKSASVAQGVDKPLKSKYKPKDFHKTISENKTGPKKSTKGKKNEKRERLSTGESEKERKEKKSKQ